jgi:hypothetical protein
MNSINRKGGALLALLILVGAAGLVQAAPGRHGGFHGVHGNFHGRSHVGVWIGSPWLYGYGPGWYGDPWYGYPYGRTVIVQQPPVYVEQGGEPTAQMWYYCRNPQGYYPYVKSCALPWRAVAPVSVQ